MPDDGTPAAALAASGSAPAAVSGGERFGRDRRVRSARDFARVRREGRSVSGGRLTLAYVARAATLPLAQPSDVPLAMPAQPDGPARVGFIVGKRVGGAVVRNRVRRRLREIMRHRLRVLLPGWDLVVIARPPAADATSADLARDLGALLRRARLLAPGYEGAE